MALTSAFVRGWIPEYLKAPVLLTTVIAAFVLADLIMHETGLITVTVMGVVMANRETDSSHMLMRFKEDLTVLLVSGVFIILSATRSEEHTSELQSLMRISYAVFCLKKKKETTQIKHIDESLEKI